jgi:transketolase
MVTEDNKQSMENSKKSIGNPVNNGGVATSRTDLHLERQWLAVRDEYLAHYPEVEITDTAYDKENFSSIFDSIAKRRQRTSKEIRDEIMEWSSTK